MKLIQSFFLGILGAIGALVLEVAALAFSTPLSSTPEMISGKINSPDHFFFITIAIEEFLKFILIVRVISRTSAAKNITLNSLFLGAGFSILELASLYWNYRNGASLEPLAVWGIMIIHISTAMIIGYFASKKSFPSLLFGYFASFAVHSAYNILGVSERPNQGQLIISFLGLLILLDSFLLIRSRLIHPEKNGE